MSNIEKGLREEYQFNPETITRGTLSALEQSGANLDKMESIKRPFVELMEQTE